MGTLDRLVPKRVFYFFEEISKIPRGSGNEKEISNYVAAFAKKHELFCYQDAANNILIKKPGTLGYEAMDALILQGHMDMVCEKNEGTEHDFLLDPLDLYIEGDYIRARGTTLGADNGIAVAYMLALLESEDIAHPPLEAVFTTDEEVGMGGAVQFDASLLSGRWFLNMDTEEEDTLLVSCCGGRRATVALPIAWEETPLGYTPYALGIQGLCGGHSGMDINRGRANANKLLARVVSDVLERFAARLASFEGGLMDNAISREARAVLLVSAENEEELTERIAYWQTILAHEFAASESGLLISLHPYKKEVKRIFSPDTARKAMDILLLIPYGVESMSLTLTDLVESSSNIGIVEQREDALVLHNALRSSVTSRKEAIYEKIVAIARLAGAEVSYAADYPAWEYRAESQMRDLFFETYQQVFGKEPKIRAVHAGLECGVFAEKLPHLDLLSIGPDMHEVHSPNERLSISSTARMWDYLLAVLRNMKP